MSLLHGSRMSTVATSIRALRGNDTPPKQAVATATRRTGAPAAPNTEAADFPHRLYRKRIVTRVS